MEDSILKNKIALRKAIIREFKRIKPSAISVQRRGNCYNLVARANRTGN